MALLLARPELAQGASAPGGGPAVRRRRRPALVARAERPRPALALLGRSAVAAVRRGASTSARPATRACSTSACRSSRRRCSRRTRRKPTASRASPPRTATLFEHCVRAIDKGLTAGAHGLPLIGSGDWNDGMNRVGPAGRGESTWLGFFLHTVLSDFAPLCRARKDDVRADRYANEARRLAQPCWSGRGTASGTGAGTTTTARRSDRRRTTSAASTRSRSRGRCCRAPCRSASPSARWTRCARRSIARGSQTLLLLNPPFDRSAQDPGYIKGYPPGVRENGGQYTHAAVWVVMALARLGSGDEAAEFFHMLNPVNHGAHRRGRRLATRRSRT